ncbi:MAG: hypothetical protein ACOC3W_02500 [Thermodesulfobacteriota bacterium]
MRGKVSAKNLVLIVLLLTAGGCASTETEVVDYGLIPTRRITFYCDERINQGQLLPVDVIYIQRYHMPSQVISLGPDQWFDHIERDRWEEKQTLGLTGGEEKTLQLNRRWLANTKFIVIYADFKDVSVPYSQQIILDASADRSVGITVMPRSLVPGEPEEASGSSCLGWF